jgi:hypothetical protein
MNNKTNMKIIIGTNVDTNQPVILDLDHAVEERMEILGGSGSGKSHLLRCICEKANGKVQQIIISPKKEFVTLREKFDYVHVGTITEKSKPDIELNTRYAGQLALKILETGIDAIIEFSENSRERVRYVKNFLEGLLDAHEHLWHPVMIVIDEVDIWAPEKGHGEAESLGVVADLASRGRDKGFFLVAATQRISKFNKDVAAELGIKFIGKATLDNDQTRAAQELGIPSKEKTKLRELGRPNFHFYAFGQGLSDDVIKIKSLPVETTHVSGYMRNKMQKPIPTPSKIKSMISQFSDLPKEAEKEIKSKEELQRKIHEQNIQIRNLERNTKPTIDPIAIKNAQTNSYNEGYINGVKKDELKHKEKIREIKELYKNIVVNVTAFPKMMDVIINKNEMELELPPSSTISLGTKIVNDLIRREAVASINMDKGSLQTISESNNNPKLRDGAMKMLKVMAMYHPDKTTKNRVATIVGFSVGGGTFNTYLSELKRLNWITINGNDLGITQDGMDNAGSFDMIPVDMESLLNMWCAKFRDGAAKMLRIIVEGAGISKEDLGEKTGFVTSGGTFNTYLSELRRNDLIEINDNMIIPSKEFFQ